MERYESKQVQIRRPAEIVYGLLSDFRHLSPALTDKVEDWEATEDSCTFRAKGLKVGLRMAEREPNKLIKVTGEENGPMEFNFWLQLVEPEAGDTRMRIVLDIELNLMMKMMLGSKLAEGVNQIAEQIARGFNEMTV